MNKVKWYEYEYGDDDDGVNDVDNSKGISKFSYVNEWWIFGGGCVVRG